MKRIAAISFLLLACAQRANHPPDALLRDRFTRYRTDFVAIAKIFASNPKLGLLDERGFSIDHAARAEPPSLDAAEPYRSNYRAVLQKLGVKSVVRRYGGSIGFIVSVSGTWEHESAKGFEHFDAPHTPTIKSLDSAKLNCEQIYYSELESRWYLYLQSYCS